MRRTVTLCCLLFSAIATLPPAAFAADTLSLSANSTTPLPGDRVTVTASGHADQTGDLLWYSEAGGTTCASSAEAEYARPDTLSVGSSPIFSAGAFSAQGSFWAFDEGTYRVCAYLYRDADSRGGSPRASAAMVVTATVPPSTLALTISRANVQLHDSVTVTSSGVIGAPGDVRVYADPDAPDCAATTSAESLRSNSEMLGWHQVSAAGSFSLDDGLSTDKPATYRICAYVNMDLDLGSSGPRAQASATVVVVVPPDRDGDGVPDAADACPDQAATTASGCPRVPPAFIAPTNGATVASRPRFVLAGDLAEVSEADVELSKDPALRTAGDQAGSFLTEFSMDAWSLRSDMHNNAVIWSGRPLPRGTYYWHGEFHSGNDPAVYPRPGQKWTEVRRIVVPDEPVLIEGWAVRARRVAARRGCRKVRITATVAFADNETRPTADISITIKQAARTVLRLRGHATYSPAQATSIACAAARSLKASLAVRDRKHLVRAATKTIRVTQ